MILVETKISDFNTVRKLMNDLFPQIKLELISDISLPWIELPYAFTMSVSLFELDAVMEDLMQLEIDAYNTEDDKMPPSSDPLYKKYIKYGWLWDLFYDAKEHGSIKEMQ